MEKIRCDWAKKTIDIEYHDKEWGVPLHDDDKLFEFLILEGFQAGLSWNTILNKRENFRKAFDNFDYKKIAKYDQKKIDELLQNAGIIRNKLKIKAAITNANAFMKVQSEFGSFDKYIWLFTGEKTIINRWEDMKQLPATSKESDAMSKDLKKRGFKFVGSTICYANMQAIGMVNDHLVNCFRYKEIKYD
jgi:DNA-3-methyladenine glycosylase I